MNDKQLNSLLGITFISLLFASLILPIFSTSWTYETEIEYSQYEFISTAISADGQYIVASKFIGYLYFFHKSNPEPLWSVYIGGMIWNVGISSDGEYIVAARFDTTFYVFNKNSSTPLWSFSGLSGFTISGLSLSEDGQHVAVSIDKVYYFSITSSTPLWSTGIRGRTAISSNGDYVVVTNHNSVIYLFGKDSPLPLWYLDLEGDINSIDISFNGNYIAVGAHQDEKVYLFHKSNAIPLWIFDAGQRVTTVAISDNGEYIVAGTENDYVYLFHKSRSTPLWQYLTNGAIYSVAISSDGTYICAWNYIHEVFLFHKSYSGPIWRYFEPDLSSLFEELRHAISISSSGQFFTFVCDKLFFIDRNNRHLDTDFITLSFENALGLGIPLIITFSLFSISRKIIDKQIQKIKKEKEEEDSKK